MMPDTPHHDNDVTLPGQSMATGGSSPGVYVRQQQNPNDLDMLWSGSRQFHKEDRSPIIFTAAGFVLGVVITAALFFLFTQKPNVQVGDGAGVEMPSDAQIFAEENNLDFSPATPATEAPVAEPQPPAQEDSAASMLDRITGGLGSKKEPNRSEEAQSSGIGSSSNSGRATHMVQSGDTLGSIASRYYGNSGPEAVRKIVNANNLANPDDLSVGQRLIIPKP